MSIDLTLETPDSAVLPDGSIDIAQLPAAERVKFRLANDLLASQALARAPVDPGSLRKFYLEASGLGPKAVESVLAMIAHPEIVEDVLAFVRAKLAEDFNEPINEQPAAGGD